MSNASTRNFGAAQRERARRVGLDLEGSLPIGSLAVTGEPGWDAFFGSLHDKEQAANAAGMGFRADLGSIGRPPKFAKGAVSEWSDAPQAGDAGGLTERERASIGANLGLAQLTDRRRLQAEAEQRANIADAQGAYQQHVLDSVAQPREEGSITSTTEGAGAPSAAYAGPLGTSRPDVRAGDRYTMRGLPDAHPLSRRQQLLARAPGSMAVGMDAALSPQERADAAAAEAARHNVEVEKLARDVAGYGEGGTPQEYTAAPPDPKTANTVDPRTGRTPAAIHQDALSYGLEGKLPALGLSSKGPGANAKAAIQNTAGAIAQEAGVDLATVRQEFKTNQSVLNNLMPKYKILSASADTANQNIQKALDQSANVPRTGSPLVNRYTQYALGHSLTGDPELTKLETYIYAAAREYAKVTGGSYMSAAELSQAGAKKADELLNAAQTPEQLQAAAGAMQDDMNNVSAPFLKQISEVSPNVARFLATARGPQSQYGRAPAASGPPAAVGGPAVGRGGVVVVVDPDGGRHAFSSQAQADAFKKAAGIR